MKALPITDALAFAIGLLTEVAEGVERDRQVIYGGILTCQRSLDAHHSEQRRVAGLQAEFRELSARLRGARDHDEHGRAA